MTALRLARAAAPVTMVEVLAASRETGVRTLTALTLHGLRHLQGQIASDLGFSDGAIADTLGHTSAKTTRRYTRRAHAAMSQTRRLAPCSGSSDERGHNG